MASLHEAVATCMLYGDVRAAVPEKAAFELCFAGAETDALRLPDYLWWPVALPGAIVPLPVRS